MPENGKQGPHPSEHSPSRRPGAPNQEALQTPQSPAKPPWASASPEGQGVIFSNKGAHVAIITMIIISNHPNELNSPPLCRVSVFNNESGSEERSCRHMQISTSHVTSALHKATQHICGHACLSK